MRVPVCVKRGHQRQRVGELFFEKTPCGGGVGQCCEAWVCAFARQEQRDREVAFGVRQRDAHVMAARPDVQRMGFDRKQITPSSVHGGGLGWGKFLRNRCRLVPPPPFGHHGIFGQGRRPYPQAGGGIQRRDFEFLVPVSQRLHAFAEVGGFRHRRAQLG